MSNLKLYRHPLSGHSHRVELFLSILELDATLIDVDLMAGEQRSPGFLARNPAGQVPVLEDGDITLTDSNAILVYLASRYDAPGLWLPTNPRVAAAIQRRLTQASGALVQGPANARLITLFGASYDPETTVAAAHKFLGSLEEEMTSQDWTAGDQPTIADIALYSYIAHAPEGNVSLQAYPRIRLWLQNFEGLTGFVPMQASVVGLAA